MPIYEDEISSQLSNPTTEIGANQKVTITIGPNAILATDGTSIEQRASFFFITESSPIYANVDYIILNGGEILEQISEAAIYSLSYAASTMVDDIVLIDVSARFPDTTTRAYKFFNRARTEFVKCKVSADLLRAIVTSKGTAGGRKMLADFSIDNASLAGLMTQARPMIQEYTSCYQYWQKVLFAGGATDFESPMGKAGVKAGYQWDGFGGIGRSWIADSDNLKNKEPETITGNTMSRPRRYGERNPMSDWHES
ncbi:MAG: hypothetical protein E4H01_00065 [Lysobacterales bacterium]|nr:MAG: hypothetical protein E4H01_00065 [Xanthomonadales bacterium]